MNENFDESRLLSELGPELSEVVRNIRNSDPDTARVNSSVAAIEALIDDNDRNTVKQNRHSSSGQSLSNRLSWIGIFLLAGLLTVGTFLWFSVSQEVTAAQVARSIAAQDWVRATETHSEGGKRETWFSPSLNISAMSDGESIEYRNHNLGESYEFFHESQTIFLVSEAETPRRYSRWANIATCLPSLLADGLPDDPMNNIPGMSELKERVEFLGHNIEPAADGNELEYSIQCLLDKTPFEIVFFVDAETKLPVRSIMTGIHDGKEVANTVELSYPNTGPKSIYDLGVPANAKLVNRTDSGMGRILRDAVYAGAEKFDDYRAVMVEHRVGMESWWTGAQVEIIFRKGDCFRRSYSSPFLKYGPGPDEDDDIRQWWEKQLRNADGGSDGIPYSIVIGEDIWDYDSNVGIFEKQRLPGSGFYCWSLRPDMIARPPMGGSSAHLEIRVDENPKTGPEGTILYELVRTKSDRVSRSWIDPNRGYLVVQFEMGTDEQWDKQTIVEKAAQSPNGIWYPVRLRSYWRHEGKVYEDETNCYLDFDAEIPDKLFDVK